LMGLVPKTEHHFGWEVGLWSRWHMRPHAPELCCLVDLLPIHTLWLGLSTLAWAFEPWWIGEGWWVEAKFPPKKLPLVALALEPPRHQDHAPCRSHNLLQRHCRHHLGRLGPWFLIIVISISENWRVVTSLMGSYCKHGIIQCFMKTPLFNASTSQLQIVDYTASGFNGGSSSWRVGRDGTKH